jgi:hypothetical protein
VDLDRSSEADGPSAKAQMVWQPAMSVLIMPVKLDFTVIGFCIVGVLF